MKTTHTVRSILKKSVLISTFALTLLTTARAQPASVDIAHRFPGYEPTIFESESQVDELFKGMETRFRQLKPILLKFGSECTQRAETWSYDLAITHQVRLQKVFVFYTHAYQDYYYKQHGHGFKWWFHVTPMVLVKNQAGGVEERTMDRTFSDQPQGTKDWTDLFIESKHKCLENIPFSEFEGDVTSEGKSHDKAAHCYIVRAPMYDIFPESADARERGQKTALTWDLTEVRYGAKALQPKARKEFLDRVGL